MHAIRSLVLAAALLGASSGLAAAKSFVINPQAGLTTSHLSSDPGDLSTHGRVGWLVGGNLRLGGKAYLSPGVYYQQTAFKLTQKDTLTALDVEDDIGVKSFFIPVHVGVNLSSGNPNSPGGIGFRLFGGPSLTVVSSVADNDFGIEKDDYKSTSVGIGGGAGIDLSVLTLDVLYETSLGKVFKDSDNKQQSLRAAVGIKI
jgi:hypothetical protein